MAVIINGDTGINKVQASFMPNYFSKSDSGSVVFTKTGAGTATIKAGTIVTAKVFVFTFSADTSIVMPTLDAGTDYSIYVCDDGTVRADASFSAPAGYTTANSRKIGGFHYGLVAPATTVAGGSFATTGNGMIWTQGDVDDIAGINKYSFWDLKFRCVGEQRGMAFDPYVRAWAAIYFCSSNHIVNGISRYNTDVTSGSAALRPRIPLVYGGNGTTVYANGDWWTLNDVAASFGLRMPTEREFASAAYGVTEAQSLGGSEVTIPSTARQAGYTSRIGLEQASGHLWAWGADTGNYGETYSWQNVTGGRGNRYASQSTRVILGGTRTDTVNSGSRATDWTAYPQFSAWACGLRAFGDHLRLE